MGTKIQHAIDPLATTTNSNNSFTSLQYQVDDWNYLQARKLKKFQKTNNNFIDSMDRLMLEKHNIESIKKKMLIHEEIFKHQVQELHRLYSVQKRLMGELKEESKQNSRMCNSSSEMKNSAQFINKRNINHHATTQTNSGGYILHFQNVNIDDAREKSTGSCSRGVVVGGGHGGGFDLERPAALEDNYISTSASGNIDEEHVHASNKMSSTDHGSDDNEVELTLSIGASSNRSSSKNKKKSKGYQLGCINDSFKSDRGEDSSCPNTPMSSSSATFNQEKKMPHWLFGLSFNRGA